MASERLWGKDTFPLQAQLTAALRALAYYEQGTTTKIAGAHINLCSSLHAGSSLQ